MNSYLFNRSSGATSPQTFQQAETTRLLYALHSAPEVQFDSSNESKKDGRPYDGSGEAEADTELRSWAHPAGVNCVEIDKFDGK